MTEKVVEGTPICRHCGQPESGRLHHGPGSIHIYERGSFADFAVEQALEYFRFCVRETGELTVEFVERALYKAVHDTIDRAVAELEASVEEAAKGLVENPAWDYDGALEVEKDYYRGFAQKCLARVTPAIRKLGEP